MSRKRFTERQTLECLVRQGAAIPCLRCKVPFTVETARKAEREHIHELKLGGADSIENCAYSHGDCHLVETNGNGATTAGSSRHRIAKAFEPTRIEKFAVQKKPLDEPRARRNGFGKPAPTQRRDTARQLRGDVE